MTEKIRPLADRVLVKRVEQEEKTQGGIYIPDTAKEKSQRGEVLAVGPGRLAEGKFIPVSVSVGDTVVFGKYAGTDAGENHLILREDDIFGVVEK